MGGRGPGADLLLAPEGTFVAVGAGGKVLVFPVAMPTKAPPPPAQWAPEGRTGTLAWRSTAFSHPGLKCVRLLRLFCFGYGS